MSDFAVRFFAKKLTLAEAEVHNRLIHPKVERQHAISVGTLLQTAQFVCVCVCVCVCVFECFFPNPIPDMPIKYGKVLFRPESKLFLFEEQMTSFN